MKVDKQGRLVLPQRLREGLVDPPGEVLVSVTPDGLLVRPAIATGVVRVDADGLPVIAIGRRVTNEEVLAGIDGERADR